MLSPQASLIRLDAELQAVDRRIVVARVNEAPAVTMERLYWERIDLVRRWGRANELQSPKRRAGDV